MATTRRARHMAPSGAGRPQASPPRMVLAAFVIVSIVALALPFVATLVAPTNETAEKKELAAWPSPVIGQGVPNFYYLAELGAWFDDHYAFRNQLVDADAHLRADLLQGSAAPNVIVGTDGWLYYRGTLDDYQRTRPMTSRAVFNAAHNAALMQEAVQARGAAFALAIAPNKNALYPDHMPYWLCAGEGASDYERFRLAAVERGVSLVDLHGALAAAGGATGEALYYATDTHWTSTGALVGANALLAAVGSDASYDMGAPATPMSHTGDLAEMLTPLSAVAERDVAYAAAQRFTWLEGEGNVRADTIVTSATDSAAGEVVVFRDSFGNALVPYLASAYGRATFSKRTPYDLGLVGEGTTAVMVVRVERHLSSFATTPPYLLSPARDVNVGVAADAETSTTLTARVNGPYLQLGGSVDERYLTPDALVYVALTDADGTVSVREAFLVSSQLEIVLDVAPAGEPGADEVTGDAGYRAFVTAADHDPATTRADVYVAYGESLVRVAGATVADVLVDL